MFSNVPRGKSLTALPKSVHGFRVGAHMRCARFASRFRVGAHVAHSFAEGRARCLCEGVGDVVGVEALLGGVAQVIFHGVQVVEVGLQVRVHQDRGEEEDGEGQVEVEREVEEKEVKNTRATCR